MFGKRIAAHAAEGLVEFLVTKPDDEEPASFVVTYEPSKGQGWALVEMDRMLVALGGAGTTARFALGNEGDTYPLGKPAREDDELPVEHIPGAGFLDDESHAFGWVLGTSYAKGNAYVCGNGSQVYRRTPTGKWIRLCEWQKNGMQDCSFRAISARSYRDIVVGGFVEPDQELELELETRMEQQRRRELGTAIPKGKHVPAEGCLFAYDGKAWKRLVAPSVEPIVAIYEANESLRLAVTETGSVLSIVGHTATVVVASQGGKPSSTAYDAGLLYLVEARHVRVLDFVQGRETRIELPRGFGNAPGAVACGAGVLWYVDSKLGLVRHRAGGWQPIRMHSAVESAIGELA